MNHEERKLQRRALTLISKLEEFEDLAICADITFPDVKTMVIALMDFHSELEEES